MARLVVLCFLLSCFLVDPTAAVLSCWSKNALVTTDQQCADMCTSKAQETFCSMLCHCKVEGAVNDTCAPMTFAPGGILEIPENMTVGSPLFEIPVSGGEDWAYSLGRTDSVDGTPRRELEGFLKFRRFATKYEMVLDRQLDLETVFQKYGVKLTALKLELTCTLTGTDISLTDEIFLIVTPVNEWAPEFRELPLQNTIPENVKVGALVYILRSRAMDRDVNPAMAELSSFQLWKYRLDERRDGRAYFAMNDTLIGSIVLQKPLDYESLVSLGLTTFFLNVSVSDVHGATTYTTLTLYIKDVDDLPPEFYHPGCPLVVARSKPCLVSYEARVPVGYIGPVTNMSPGRVHARDMDSLNATIRYSLESAPGEEPGVVDQFNIDDTSGAIVLVWDFVSEQVVNLVIVARELSEAGRSTQASLRVTAFQESNGNDDLVAGMIMDDPQSRGTKSSNAGDSDGLPAYMIVTLTLGLILLASHLVICIVWIKVKNSQQERMRVAPTDTPNPEGQPGQVICYPDGDPSYKPQAPLQSYSHTQTSEYSRVQDGKISQSRISLRYEERPLPQSMADEGREDIPVFSNNYNSVQGLSAPAAVGPADTRAPTGNNIGVSNNVSPYDYEDKVDRDIHSIASSLAPIVEKHGETGQTAEKGRSNNNWCPDDYGHPQPLLQLSYSREESIRDRSSASDSSPDKTIDQELVRLQKHVDQNPQSPHSSGSGGVTGDDSMTEVSEVTSETAGSEKRGIHDIGNSSSARPTTVGDTRAPGHEVLSLLTLERASLQSVDVKQASMEINTNECEGNVPKGAPDGKSSEVLGLATAQPLMQKDIGQEQGKLDKNGQFVKIDDVNPARLIVPAHGTDTDYLMARPFTGPGHRYRENETGPQEQTMGDDHKAIRSAGQWVDSTRVAIDIKGDDTINKQRPSTISGDRVLEVGPDRHLKKKKKKKRENNEKLRGDKMYGVGNEISDIAQEVAVAEAQTMQGNIPARDFMSGIPHRQGRIIMDELSSNRGSLKNRPFGSARSAVYAQKRSVPPDRSRLQPYMILHHEKQKQEAAQLRQQKPQQNLQNNYEQPMEGNQLLESQRDKSYQMYQGGPLPLQQTQNSDNANMASDQMVYRKQYKHQQRQESFSLQQQIQQENSRKQTDSQEGQQNRQQLPGDGRQQRQQLLQLENDDMHQRQLHYQQQQTPQRKHRSGRSYSEQRRADKYLHTEDEPRRRLPSTAPEHRHADGQAEAQSPPNNKGCVDQTVQSWVNLTHGWNEDGV